MSLNFIIWFFGFISGFLLLVTGNTLNFWIAKDGCNLEVISLFSLVSIPYALNFLWAPLFDQIKLEFIQLRINYRLKWLVLLHVIGALLVALLCVFDPAESAEIIALLAFLISFINASQDVVLNALRSEITPPKAQASTSGIYIFGYRSGMVLSGPVAIYVSQYVSWQNIYFFFASLYFIFPIILLILNNSKLLEFSASEIKPSKEPISGLKAILSEIGTPKTIFLILIFLVLYRIADNFIAIMLNPFLLEQGYNESQISVAGKLCGVVGAAFGGLYAGRILARNSITKCLLWFAVIHAFSHASYITLALIKTNSFALIIATLAESITSGMTMAAYIGFITKLCYGKYRATQYGLFSAMMGASRTILPSFAGFLVINTSWITFFIISVIMVIPSIMVLKTLEPHIKKKIND